MEDKEKILLSQLQIDEYGLTMPTLHNEDIFNELGKIAGDELQLIKKYPEYNSFSMRRLFDPRKNENIYYTSKEQLTTAQKLWAEVTRLDQEYLKEKQSK